MKIKSFYFFHIYIILFVWFVVQPFSLMGQVELPIENGMYQVVSNNNTNVDQFQIINNTILGYLNDDIVFKGKVINQQDDYFVVENFSNEMSKFKPIIVREEKNQKGIKVRKKTNPHQAEVKTTKIKERKPMNQFWKVKISTDDKNTVSIILLDDSETEEVYILEKNI